MDSAEDAGRTQGNHHRNQAQIDAESVFDGVRALRTRPSQPAGSARVATVYNNLKHAERTSGKSRPTMWTCSPSATTAKTRSKPRADLQARLLPHLAPSLHIGPLTFTR
jgi:hypothetical protein